MSVESVCTFLCHAQTRRAQLPRRFLGASYKTVINVKKKNRTL